MFEIANPWVLALVLVPVVLWYILPPLKTELPLSLKVPFFQAMQGIAKQDEGLIQSSRAFMIPSIIWACLVIALSGPRWVGEPKPVVREGYNIMMALDLSGSMEIMDMM